MIAALTLGQAIALMILGLFIILTCIWPLFPSGQRAWRRSLWGAKPTDKRAIGLTERSIRYRWPEHEAEAYIARKRNIEYTMEQRVQWLRRYPILNEYVAHVLTEEEATFIYGPQAVAKYKSTRRYPHTRNERT